MTDKILMCATLTILLLLSCQTKRNETVSTDTIKTDNKIKDVDSLKKEEKFDVSSCVRGKAEPILKKDRFPNSRFKINKNGLTGTESTDLKEGDKLIITNGGCEYYVLGFRFETSRFQHDTTDINFWSAKIVDLMNEITDGIDAPIDLKKGTNELRKYIANNEIKILEELIFEPGEIRTYLTIDRVQKMDNKKYGLEISYIVGPL